MKPEHKAAIAKYRRLKRLYRMNPYEFLRSRWADHPEKYLSLRGMSYESVSRLAESYRETELKPILEKLRNDRVSFVDSWGCRRRVGHCFQGAKAQAAILTALLFSVRGCENHDGEAYWDPESMLEGAGFTVGLIIISALAALATGHLVWQFTGRKVSFSARFSALLLLILIAVLFHLVFWMFAGR